VFVSFYSFSFVDFGIFIFCFLFLFLILFPAECFLVYETKDGSFFFLSFQSETHCLVFATKLLSAFLFLFFLPLVSFLSNFFAKLYFHS